MALDLAVVSAQNRWFFMLSKGGAMAPPGYVPVSHNCFSEETLKTLCNSVP